MCKGSAMKIGTGIALALALAAASPAVAAGDDRFKAFWAGFAAAAAKDDVKALARMTVLSSEFGEDSTFAKLHADLLRPEARRCIAKAKPDYDAGSASYNVVCRQMLYVFTKAAGSWKFTSISPDD
jgi:hypothetical protein